MVFGDDFEWHPGEIGEEVKKRVKDRGIPFKVAVEFDAGEVMGGCEEEYRPFAYTTCAFWTLFGYQITADNLRSTLFAIIKEHINEPIWGCEIDCYNKHLNTALSHLEPHILDIYRSISFDKRFIEVGSDYGDYTDYADSDPEPETYNFYASSIEMLFPTLADKFTEFTTKAKDWDRTAMKCFTQKNYEAFIKHAKQGHIHRRFSYKDLLATLEHQGTANVVSTLDALEEGERVKAKRREETEHRAKCRGCRCRSWRRKEVVVRRRRRRIFWIRIGGV